ncbi:DUF4395 family protein [Propionivibrio dicarboxylicus]|uniref:DUF4395 domain-containing protein n=1 Tax=Propionivibrio dicarboxylicus TaxID=83767 RepID=A0A1G7ZF81_9RHOO|nr:DUF4395 family protein [Propionivibrio dicarboxylicus]SDH07433.1 protein of unknown function [Propionivibrio dicarboxylicus]
MLRFDIAPVDSNAYRGVATLSFIVAALYLFSPYPWVALVLALGGFLRGFVSPHRCPSYKLFERISARLGKTKKVNAGSKMFADKIAAIAGTAMVVTAAMGSDVGAIPATAILIFAFLDATTGFCAACWAYAAWYRLRAARA